MAKVQVLLPAALRLYAGGASKVAVDAATLGDALHALGELAPRVLDDAGRVRRHVHVFLNQRATTDLDARLAEGDVIHVLPAVSGGSDAHEER